MHALLHTDVGKDRFHDPQPPVLRVRGGVRAAHPAERSEEGVHAVLGCIIFSSCNTLRLDKYR
jgi:hypothetical protein